MRLNRPLILAIETSCDETAAAVTCGRSVFSNIVYSQIPIHRKWGGVVPHLAKREHEKNIDLVIKKALEKANIQINKIDYIAVTQGPGLPPALEVGIKKAKELGALYNIKLIPVNHMVGHIYSVLVEDENGKPAVSLNFPSLALLISGGHTELVLMKGHLDFVVLGRTLDDAVGESLDKGARLLTGRGYPGGPIIEKLSIKGNPSYHRFPRPMVGSKDLNFSYSGIKTSLFYFLSKIEKKEKERHICDIAASYQEAIFDSIVKKLDKALKLYKVNSIIVAGGVVANKALKEKLILVAKKKSLPIFFPSNSSVIGDNAAMIGVAAYYYLKKNIIFSASDKFERIPKMELTAFV